MSGFSEENRSKKTFENTFAKHGLNHDSGYSHEKNMANFSSYLAILSTL